MKVYKANIMLGGEGGGEYKCFVGGCYIVQLGARILANGMCT